MHIQSADRWDLRDASSLVTQGWKIEVMLNLWTKDKQRNKKTPSMQGTCHHARRILQDIVSEIEVGPESKIPGARGGWRNAGCTMTQYPCTVLCDGSAEERKCYWGPVWYLTQLQKKLKKGTVCLHKSLVPRRLPCFGGLWRIPFTLLKNTSQLMLTWGQPNRGSPFCLCQYFRRPCCETINTS